MIAQRPSPYTNDKYIVLNSIVDLNKFFETYQKSFERYAKFRTRTSTTIKENDLVNETYLAMAEALLKNPIIIEHPKTFIQVFMGNRFSAMIAETARWNNYTGIAAKRNRERKDVFNHFDIEEELRVFFKRVSRLPARKRRAILSGLTGVSAEVIGRSIAPNWGVVRQISEGVREIERAEKMVGLDAKRHPHAARLFRYNRVKYDPKRTASRRKPAAAKR